MADVATMEVADTRLAAVATTETATIGTRGEDLTRVIEDLLTTIGGAEMTEAMIVEPTRRLGEARLRVETISHHAETSLLLATVVECPPSEKAGGENNNALTAIEA